MTLDVSDGPASSGLVSWSHRRLDLCLKRPSFNCLIHFYKRCVSSLALVSHNLLYSGLKKAHSKMKSMKKNKNALYDFHVNSGAVALSVAPE